MVTLSGSAAIQGRLQARPAACAVEVSRGRGVCAPQGILPQPRALAGTSWTPRRYGLHPEGLPENPGPSGFGEKGDRGWHRNQNVPGSQGTS